MSDEPFISILSVFSWGIKQEIERAKIRGFFSANIDARV